MLPSISGYYIYNAGKTKCIVYEKPIEIDADNFKKIVKLQKPILPERAKGENEYLYYHPSTSTIPKKGSKIFLRLGRRGRYAPLGRRRLADGYQPVRARSRGRRFPDAPVDLRRRVPRHRGPAMDRYEGFLARGTRRSTLDALTVAWSDLRRPFP